MSAGQDARFMAVALALARRGLGRVWPNPSVGCVVVRNDRIVGRGWTAPGGRPHAETVALAAAGRAGFGATVYVSLEPCAHYGLTPPCTMALIHAGVRRVVAAAADPDPRVDGRGIAQLRQAGVKVDVGVGREEAERLNEGFFLRVREGRPLVTLKLATSLDGRIAAATGESRWITGDPARAQGHLLRASHDAILVGSGTVLADDPELTCRLPGLGDRSPVRVVLDRRRRVPPSAKVVATACDVPTWVVGSDAGALAGTAVEMLPVESGLLPDVLAALAGRGITRLLVEGGAEVAGAFIAAGLVDRIALFQAPVVLGGDGLAAVAGYGVSAPAQAARFVTLDRRALGDDLLWALGRTGGD